MNEVIPSFFVACEGKGRFKNSDLSAAPMVISAMDENKTDCTNFPDPIRYTKDNFKELQIVEMNVPNTLAGGGTLGSWITSCSSSIICSGRRNYDVQKWFAEKQNRPNLATIEMAL